MSKIHNPKRPRHSPKRPTGLFRFFGSEGPAPAAQIDPSTINSHRSSGLRGGGQTEKEVVVPGGALAGSVRPNYPAPPPRDPDTKLAALASAGLAPLAGDGIVRPLNFWEVAYREIIDDKEDETRTIVEAYDALLDRVAQQGAEEEGDDEGLREGDHGLSDSESTEGGDAAVKRRVGCEEEMRSIAVEKLGEMQRKEWVMKWNGHVFTVREQVTRIVKIMQHMSGLVGQAASSNPSAGLAWAGVCVILPLIINDTEEREAAINGVEHVARVVARFRTVEDDYVSGRFTKNEDFEKSLVSLYRSLAYFYMKSACYFARSTPFRTIRGLVAADAWISTLESVKESETECYRFAAMLGCSSSLVKIDKVLEDLSRMEFKDLIRDVEDWLIPDVNVAQLHQSKQPKLALGYDKAGSWLLESTEFKSWEEETGGQFWIKGPVGTGKSSLVAIIVDHMRRTPQSDFAFFYCTLDHMGATQVPKNMEDDVAVTRILRGLLGQLAMSPDRRRIAEEIEVAFNRSSQSGGLGRIPLSLKDAKDLLVNVINSRCGTTIIIDGLDEVSNYRHLLQTLRDIHEQVDAENLRLLLASQSVVPVGTYFPSAKLAVAGGRGSISDMESFINGRVQLFNATSPIALSSAVSKDIVETLSERAEGMFKWAELCLARVLDDEKSSAEIAEYWESVKLQEFRGLLLDLIGSYEYLYNKSLPKGDHRERGMVQRASQRALLWALGTERLSHDQYLELLTGETNEVSAGKTLKVCQNFLDEFEEIITASHSSVWDFVSLKVTDSVEEFMVAGESDTPSDMNAGIILQRAKSAAATKAQHQLATDCLKMVTSREAVRPWDRPGPLLVYACSNWVRHSKAVMSSGGDSDVLRGMRKALFEPENVAFLQRWAYLDYLPLISSESEYPDPLYHAVQTGHDDIVQFVLDKTERSSWKGGYDGKALQLACYLGRKSMVREMLRKTNVEESDDSYGTPLHAAIAGSQREVYDLLVDEHNANVNAPSVVYGNAVQMALALEDQDLLESLVNHGALYDPSDCRGRIWDKAWRSMQTSGLWKAGLRLHYFSMQFAGMLNARILTRSDLDSRLGLLHTCVACQRNATEPNNVRGLDLSPLAAHQMRTASITSSGFIPIVFTWACLSETSTWTNRQKALLKHETFIQTIGGIIQVPYIEEVLGKLFALVLMEQASRFSIRSWKSKNFHYLPNNDQVNRRLEALDREAEELERRSKETLAISQHSTVMSAMDKMAGEISDMRQQVTQLTSTVQLLLDLQQKPEAEGKARSQSSASTEQINE